MNKVKRHLSFMLCCLFLAAPCATYGADCQVRFLNRDDAEEIDEGFRDKIIPRTGDYQKLVVQTALNAVPPLVCASVRRIVFVDDPTKVAVAFTNTTRMINDGRPADLIYFNNSAMPEVLLKPHEVNFDDGKEDAQEINRIAAIHAVIHEAIHVADHLLDSQRVENSWFGEDPVDESLWSGAAISLAKQAVKRNRLKMGFRQEWERMHGAFVKAGMAREYYGKGGGADLKDVEKVTSEEDADGNPISAKDRFGRPIMIKPAPIELAAAGFMSQYGGTQSSEDIAEMTAGVLTRLFVEKTVGAALGRDSDLHAAIEDHACEALRESPEGSISTQMAAMYSKLGFLQSVGFIPLEGFKRCVGNLKIDAPGQGFYSYKGGNLSRQYTGNPRAGVGRGTGQDEEWLLANITADGDLSTTSGSVPVTVELILNVTPPVGALTDPGKRAERVAISPADVSYPRGVYFIGFRNSPHNRLLIRRQSDGAVIVDVGQGVALVGRASSETIEGSVFVQRIFNYSGGLLSAIAGDEPVSEESRMTFRYNPN